MTNVIKYVNLSSESIRVFEEGKALAKLIQGIFFDHHMGNGFPLMGLKQMCTIKLNGLSMAVVCDAFFVVSQPIHTHNIGLIFDGSGAE